MGYPTQALAAGVTGTVYVALRIDRSGHVAQAQAFQVNLRYLAGEWLMRRWRKLLADNAVKRLRQFTFLVPTTGPAADDDYYDGVIPVRYELSDQPPVAYGEWDRYVPGPKEKIPWREASGAASTDDAETAQEGEFASAGAGLKLLTPLDGGS